MRCDLNMLQAKCMTQEIGNYTILRASKFQKQNGVAVSCGLKHMQAKALTNKLVTAIVELRTIFGLQIYGGLEHLQAKCLTLSICWTATSCGLKS